MATIIGRRGRMLIGLVAAMVLLAITSVPSMVSAAPQKKYTLEVSPATGATAGVATEFTVKMTNVTPPGTNSNPSSFYVTVPFEISGDIFLEKDPDIAGEESLAGSTNPNLSASVAVDLPSNPRRILVTSLDPVKKGQFVLLTFTATPASCEGSPFDWVDYPGEVLDKVANGASLNGDTFAPNTDPVNTEVSCAPPTLSVTKTADAESVVAGHPIGFEIKVTNSGAPATGVTLTDVLPTGTGLIWVIESQTPPNTCTIASLAQAQGCTIGTLAGGSEYTVHVTSETDTDMVGDTISNTASVKATNVTPDPAPASASITVFADGLSCENLSEQFGMDGGTTTIEFADPAECTDVPFTFSYDRDANELEIEKDALTEGVGLLVTAAWPAELAPTGAANLQVTPTEVTPPTPFHPVEWCVGNGTIAGSTPPPPEGEEEPEVWCIFSQTATNVGPGEGGQLIQVTDVLLLFGDANGRR